MTTTAPRPSTSPRHPARDLLTRYRAIFQAAWQHRKELAAPPVWPMKPPFYLLP